MKIFSGLFKFIIIAIILFGIGFWIIPSETKKNINDAINSYTVHKTTDTVYVNVSDTIVTEKVIDNTKVILYKDSIPFDFVDNKMKVTVYVNNVPVNTVLNTNMDSCLMLSNVEYDYFVRNNIIDISNVKTISTSDTTEVKNVIVKNVQVGTMIFDNVTVTYNDVKYIPENIFGLNVFGKKFTVDYTTKNIYFY